MRLPLANYRQAAVDTRSLCKPVGCAPGRDPSGTGSLGASVSSGPGIPATCRSTVMVAVPTRQIAHARCTGHAGGNLFERGGSSNGVAEHAARPSGVGSTLLVAEAARRHLLAARSATMVIRSTSSCS